MIIGVGCDIVAINRLKQNQEAMAKRILSKKEYLCYHSFHNERQLEYLAGRFAAKEAIVKAIDKKILLSEIEVLNDDRGKPVCSMDGYVLHVSIAHEKDYATAYVICEK